MQVYLINILIFCGILLLLALTVAVVQVILIFLDVRRISHEVKKKVVVLTSMFDIVSLLLGGMEQAKKKIGKKLSPNKATLVAFVAGLQKSLQVLLGK